MHIAEQLEAGTPFPENSAYESYEEWQRSAEKEIKSYHTMVSKVNFFPQLKKRKKILSISLLGILYLRAI